MENYSNKKDLPAPEKDLLDYDFNKAEQDEDCETGMIHLNYKRGSGAAW